MSNIEQPDEMDWKIIDLLRTEHLNNHAIARELGVSEGMIRQRIKRLKEAEILRVRGQINPDILEDQQLAMIGINLHDASLLESKAKEISKLPQVLSASIVSGRYDVMAEVLVNSNKGLVDFLTRSLSSISGINSSETFLILKSFHRYV
jgi:Lrp/AsnC family transcriptional regulator for asnA, asnC and gidA